MARMTNTPQQTLTFDLERRKSYSFRCILTNADYTPLDLTGCLLRFVMKRAEFDSDLYDSTNELVNSEALVASPESGEATFAFQAAELDGDPGAYNYSIVLWTPDGYSVVVAKGLANLHANTESASVLRNYSAISADAAVEIMLRGNDIVSIVANTLTKSDVRADIVGTGRPDDPSTLEASTINKVTNAVVGTLFISLDGAGQNMWAWRKRIAGWAQIEGLPLKWVDIQGRPSLFPPESHTHHWDSIGGKPTSFVPAHHAHLWNEVADKPATYPPSAHTHLWAHIEDRPSTFPSAPHSHNWMSITDKPVTFPPSEHNHDWVDIDGKPTAFNPSAHTHQIEDIFTDNLPEPGTFLSASGRWETPESSGGLSLPLVTTPNTVVLAGAGSTRVDLLSDRVRAHSPGSYTAFVSTGMVANTLNGELAVVVTRNNGNAIIDQKSFELWEEQGEEGETFEVRSTINWPPPAFGSVRTFATTADIAAALGPVELALDAILEGTL